MKNYNGFIVNLNDIQAVYCDVIDYNNRDEPIYNYIVILKNKEEPIYVTESQYIALAKALRCY